MKRDCGLALSRIGPAAVPPLLKALEEPSTQIDVMAAIAWHGSDAADAVPKLREILKGADAAKRMQALETLGRLGPAAKDAVPDMIAALKDKDHLVRAMAAASFKSMGGDESVLAPLREALDDEHPIVRKMAKETLQLIDRPKN
jgi:HEAT repeat protein